HVSRHHCRAGFQSELVRCLHYLQPLVAVNFQRRYFLPHLIHENFSAAARNRSKSSLLEFRNHFAQRHPEGLCEMLKLRWTEPVNIDVWIFFADVDRKSTRLNSSHVSIS